MARLFGTDGVRGLANRDITAELAVELGVAAAHVLGDLGAFAGGGCTAIVARDPRPSGDFLTHAVAAGLSSAGVEVLDAGVIPTPGLAYLVAESGVDLGVMLSASHNPMQDNGIKFFNRHGTKLADEVEDKIEAALHDTWDRPTGDDVGRVRPYQGAVERYVGHLVSTIDTPLDGLRVVVDCANGASSVVGPTALRAAGADVTVIGADPVGPNINDGYGSTHLEHLKAEVVARGADAGVAYDGDADRCLAVDAAGTEVDGDQIMGILAVSLKEKGRLVHDTLVATVMSNLGLKLGMDSQGIELIRTAVGDRYVLEEMQRGGFSIGGEQSGHVILTEHATTGDGTLTSLQLLSRMAETGRSLADLASIVTRFPQTLINVTGVDKARAAEDEPLLAAVRAAESELGETGRVLLRPSGTEPLVRVMVEAATQDHARAVASRLAGVVSERLAL